MAAAAAAAKIVSGVDIKVKYKGIETTLHSS